MNIRLLRLIPSKARLKTIDSAIPLWETIQGEPVYCRTGIKGHSPLVDAASGTVPCRWQSKNELAIFNPGVPPEGIDVKGINPQNRQLLIQATDGLLESVTVTCFEQMELLQ